MNPRLWYSIVIFVMCSGISGCGYKPVNSTTVEDKLSVCVPVVRNETPYINISGPLSTGLRRKLSARGAELGASGQQCEIVLEVRVFSISDEVGAIALSDDRARPVDTTWRMDAMISVNGHNDEVHWGPSPVSVTVTVPVPATVMDEMKLQNNARDSLVEALVERVALVLLEQS